MECVMIIKMKGGCIMLTYALYEPYYENWI